MSSLRLTMAERKILVDPNTATVVECILEDAKGEWHEVFSPVEADAFEKGVRAAANLTGATLNVMRVLGAALKEGA